MVSDEERSKRLKLLLFPGNETEGQNACFHITEHQ